ncbi:MAG TPA: 30S ribosomal protein S3 [Candidatus Moranbacteria bacterium]|nr:MAG: ribosomal protein S3, small subunit ribosomal protein S3 [Parcubacteria group bacterium GW2011_GWC1_36_108]KKQ00480.1 MAG: 30S ribosomal protein S3 [Candidatus Moranbacteria bacterium GW2011_GWD1_36_198]KKQ01712.1 MAG: 30S ribosomal protein S3 [Candidatus Moranbacteria bacterium GW2011_GWD2_36_198]KKQ39603.1 MAG: 30S ribosomal protein S3 [Candidatus Moranbacteria bacterium GW2011_GWC2_37_73]HAR99966.1 30S ribosomal protein S3 [Candidatus Moranbacteria bacterium]
MGHKVNPTGLRLGITTTWKSRWFAGKDYTKKLKEDVQVREFVMKKWKSAAIADVEIERSANTLKLIIKTSRPGVLIGRGGTGIGDMSAAIKTKFFAGKKIDLRIEAQEVRQFEENASLVAQNVAEQLEKRVPFRRILKSMLDQVEKNKNIKGVKIEVSGRLGGAEMSRREWLSRGTVPLHTLRADIDFSKATAFTTYGAIGVKTWLYKGEVFDKE